MENFIFCTVGLFYEQSPLNLRKTFGVLKNSDCYTFPQL